jgi:hypothetical protein
MENARTELTTVKKVALKILDDLKEMVMNGCDDEEITSTLTKWHPESNNYFKQDDYVTADKAMRILHLGSNRNRFFALLKEYKVKNHKFSNQNIGYLKADIERMERMMLQKCKNRKP